MNSKKIKKNPSNASSNARVLMTPKHPRRKKEEVQKLKNQRRKRRLKKKGT